MSPLALITGSTGFIGSAVTLRVLEAGYRVRLVIRRADQATKLKQIFAKHHDHLEFAIVPDLTVPGCYDRVLDGVEYVLHLASPLPAPGTDDLLTPALEGTKAMLDAASKATSLKRVVITSSVIALIPLGGQRDGLIVKETNSIDRAIDPSAVPTLPPMGQYHASKLAAHKATLDFVQGNQPRYNTICLHPVFVFGRSLVQTTAEELSGTPGMLWQSLNSEKPTMSQFLGVHIDDVAEAHVKALEVPNHGDDSDVKGVRSYLLAAERRPWADAVQLVKSQYPDVQWPLSSVDATNYAVDTTRAEKELGITFKGMEEQVKDVVDQQLEFRK